MNIASVVQRKNNTRIQNAIRKSNSDIHRLIQQYVDAMIEPDIPEWIPKALHLEEMKSFV